MEEGEDMEDRRADEVDDSALSEVNGAAGFFLCEGILFPLQKRGVSDKKWGAAKNVNSFEPYHAGGSQESVEESQKLSVLD
jgi:hypothetical protein